MFLFCFISGLTDGDTSETSDDEQDHQSKDGSNSQKGKKLQIGMPNPSKSYLIFLNDLN